MSSISLINSFEDAQVEWGWLDGKEFGKYLDW